MDIDTFLWSVITTDSGWLCLAHLDSDEGEWIQEWYGWPDDKDAVLKRIEELKQKYDVYYSPYLFKEPKSKKQYVLPTRTVVADLDEANILTLPKAPTVLVETSPERHQGYWILRDIPESLDKLEELAQRLTYAIPRCDRTGWFLGKMLRVPTTFNYKYASGPKQIRIVAYDITTKCNILDLENLPPVPSSVSEYTGDNDDWILEAENSKVGPQELLATLATKLPARVVATYDIENIDRSTALWGLMTNAFRAGCSREQVYILAKHSANNKFADLKYGANNALAKDVLRAEQTAANPKSNIRERISEARKLRGTLVEKRMYITDMILKEMQKLGQFVHCEDGSIWYVREDTGRPIQVSMKSEQLNVLLDIMFGINATETECNFIKSHLVAYCNELPQSGVQASLSYYDNETRNLLLHTGRRDVLLINKSELRTVTNGYGGIIFPWRHNTKLLTPDKGHLKKKWHDEVFGDCLDNLVGMTKAQALAVLRVWTIIVVIRNAVVSRPILALLGQPGAGKSTMFRRVYTLLYGEQKSLNAITSAEEFDFAIANDPLVVFDNVDTWERWLPDRLALSVTNSEMTRRKLYTDSDTITLKRQAIIGLTAHNPKFGREDVADRLLILNFERLQNFQSETEILDKIVKLRNYIWGEIVQEIQQVFNTPFPTNEEVPQFRVEDFARVGYWIAKALDIQRDFEGAITTLRSEQRSFALEDDSLLIKAITKSLDTWSVDNQQEWRGPGQLWQYFKSFSGEPLAFEKNYRNAVALGRKLWSLQEALKSVYRVEWKYDSNRQTRVWRFLPLESPNGRS